MSLHSATSPGDSKHDGTGDSRITASITSRNQALAPAPKGSRWIVLRHALPVQVRRRLFAVREAVRGIVDWRSLQVHQPELRGLGGIAQKSRSRLQALHEEYIQNVSPSYMAISLELGSVLTGLCAICRPRSILDLGSGFSSVVFREYSRVAQDKPLVWSVDDSEDWLHRSRQFLARHGLSTENLMTWKSFAQDGSQRFDLVLHDLGSMDFRRETLAQAIASTRWNGILVLDDVHKPSYASYVREMVKKIGAQSYSLRSVTRDSFSRYGMLVRLPSATPSESHIGRTGKI